MKKLLVSTGIALALSVLSCGAEHTDLPTGFRYLPPPTPADLTVEGGTEECIVRWTYPAEGMPSLEEFRVYYYLEAYGLLELVGTTTDTEYVDSLLIGNLSYCYAVSAVDTSGLEGWRAGPACAMAKSSR